MDSLEEIHAKLRVTLANDAQFAMLNARLVLRTGVDLRAIKPAYNDDPRCVRKVLEALTAFGYPPSSLASAPSPKAPGR